MKAHVRDNIVVNVCSNAQLEESFHPEVAALFETVPNHVREGYRRDEEGKWSPPPEPEEED